MAAEPFVISNPRENNVNLVVTAPDGKRGVKTLALLRPGESFRADQPLVRVKAVAQPARLQQDADGVVRPDTRRAPPKLARRPVQ